KNSPAENLRAGTPSSVEGLYLLRNLAEREGFEPPIALRLCLISSQVHSTGLCHLSVYCQRITGCSLDLFLPVSVVVSNLGKKMTPICLRRQRYAQGRDVNSA